MPITRKKKFIDNEHLLDLGDQIRKWRLRRGLRQSDLERKTGLAHNALSRIETGDVSPRLETVERIAEALSISPEELQFKQPSRETVEIDDATLKQFISRLQNLPDGRKQLVINLLSPLLDLVEEP